VTIFVRLVVLFAAYLLACIAASAIITVGTFTPDWDLSAFGGQTFMLSSIIAIGGGVIAGIALLPALILIALGEGFAVRSGIVYALLGAALALALGYGIDFSGYAGVSADGSLPRGRELLAAAGIAGGFVYWLFAGRRAGAWK
jgi:hypothetical protein